MKCNLCKEEINGIEFHDIENRKSYHTVCHIIMEFVEKYPKIVQALLDKILR